MSRIIPNVLGKIAAVGSDGATFLCLKHQMRFEK
jgi:hypothetical protein